MTFVSVAGEQTNIPVATDDGARGRYYVPSSSYVSRGTEDTVYLADDDVDEIKLLAGITHNPRLDPGIPTNYRIDDESVRRLQTAAFLTGWVAYGWIKDIAYNTSNGNNIEHRFPVKITACSSSSVTISGVDVHKIGHSVRTPNPDWPAPGEDRWITTTEYGALPIGASLEFGPGSILYGKVETLITSYTRNSATTATLNVTNDCSNAMSPWDAAFPPGEYTGYITYHRVSGVPYQHQSASDQQGWIKRSVSIPRSELDSGDIHTLKTNGGNNTRILYPNMVTSIDVLKVVIVHDSIPDYTMTEGDLLSALSTSYSGGTYTTQLDFTAALATYGASDVTFNIDYYYAMTEDDDATYTDYSTFRFNGQCLNCRRYYGANPSHDTVDHCAQRADASEFASFHDNCYLPDCDQFSWKTEDGTIVSNGSNYDGRLSLSNSSWLGQTVSGIDAVLVQSVVGFPYFTIDRKQHNSLYQLCGGFHTLQTGYYPTREPWNYPHFHNRYEYTDSNGDKRQQLVSGAWIQRGWVDFDGAEQDYYNAATTNHTKGVLSNIVNLSGKTAPTNVTYPTLPDNLDRYYIHNHPSYIHGYTFDVTNNIKTNVLVTNTQLYATNVDKDNEDTDLNDWAQARFVGL